MNGPKRNSEFCFSKTLNIPQGEAKGNIEVKPFWIFLELNSRILDLIWRGTTYFVANDKTIFLPADSGWRVSCQMHATHFWHQIKSFKTQNVQIFLFVNLICFAKIIINPFSWVVNASSSEKPLLTTLTLCHLADWHTNLPWFQGTQPDHVRAESSSCCFPWE